MAPESLVDEAMKAGAFGWSSMIAGKNTRESSDLSPVCSTPDNSSGLRQRRNKLFVPHPEDAYYRFKLKQIFVILCGKA